MVSISPRFGKVLLDDDSIRASVGQSGLLAMERVITQYQQPIEYLDQFGIDIKLKMQKVEDTETATADDSTSPYLKMMIGTEISKKTKSLSFFQKLMNKIPGIHIEQPKAFVASQLFAHQTTADEFDFQFALEEALHCAPAFFGSNTFANPPKEAGQWLAIRSCILRMISTINPAFKNPYEGNSFAASHNTGGSYKTRI